MLTKNNSGKLWEIPCSQPVRGKRAEGMESMGEQEARGQGGVQPLKHSALWDTAESREILSLSWSLQVLEGTTAPEDRSGKSKHL